MTEAKEKPISFAREVKEEIVKYAWSEPAERSLLSAYIKDNGHLHRADGVESLELVSESAAIIKAMYGYIHSIYGLDPTFAYSKGMGFSKRSRYHLILKDPEDLLSDLEVSFFEGKLPHSLTEDPEQAAAYLAGSFLSSGSVNDPSSSNYHLEISFSQENYAKWWSHLLNKVQGHQFKSKLSKRRNEWIVYIKKSEEISDFLVYIGAPESCLKFENVRVDRDFSNIGNRLANLDMANLSKTLSTGKRQKEEIEYFASTMGLDNVSNPKLQALMKLRLEHEDASLEELASLLSEELSTTISKSNVNHLFRYLHEEYKKAHHEN